MELYRYNVLIWNIGIYLQPNSNFFLVENLSKIMEKSFHIPARQDDFIFQYYKYRIKFIWQIVFL
jgi:hypothetical protein